MSLTTTQVVEAANEIGETRLPATTLIRRLQEKYHVNAIEAAKAYRKAFRENALVQRHVDRCLNALSSVGGFLTSIRWAQNIGQHAQGMYNVPTSFCTWRKGENNDNEH